MEQSTILARFKAMYAGIEVPASMQKLSPMLVVDTALSQLSPILTRITEVSRNRKDIMIRHRQLTGGDICAER